MGLALLVGVVLTTAQNLSAIAVGSTVAVGHDLTINAQGGGNQSDLSVTGSALSAGNNLTLAADHAIKLHAAANTASNTGTYHNSSASVGIGYEFGGAQNGFSINLAASQAQDKSNGQQSSWTDTAVNAGNTLALHSGGDTHLIGAVAGGKQITANIGGNLTIASLQDTNTYTDKGSNSGFSLSLCIPPLCYGASGGSVNLGQRRINSQYASVQQQSGLEAGDQGFQIQVQGNTGLTGGVIESTQAATDSGKNRLSTGTLTTGAIQNQARYSGQSVSIGGGYSVGPGDGAVGSNQAGQATAGPGQIPGTTLPSNDGVSASPPVALSASGNAASRTQSGISGGTISITDGRQQQALTGQTATQALAGVNTAVATGKHGANALAPIFDARTVKEGFAIAGAFTQQAGTLLANKARESDILRQNAKNPTLSPQQQSDLIAQADQIDANWGPGGTDRQILTALTAAAGGNVTGTTAQLAQNAVVDYVQQQGAAYIGKLVSSGTIGEGSPANAALHAIVACAGATAASQSCGSGAMGAAAASVLTDLFTASPEETQSQKQAKASLIETVVAGIASGTGSNSATATNAATANVENNYLTSDQIVAEMAALTAAKSAAEKQQIKQSYAKLDATQQQEGKQCLSGEGACPSVMINVQTLQGMKQQLQTDCGPPRSCAAQAQQSIGDINNLLAIPDAITPDHTLETYLAAGAIFNLGLKAVGIVGNVLTGGAAAAVDGVTTAGEVAVGTKVFRVFGENNKALGASWTRVDPSTVSNYRNAAGLPDVNTGRFVIEGTILDITGITTRSALPLNGNAGGLDELLIPNASSQVRITNVSGVNPDF